MDYGAGKFNGGMDNEDQFVTPAMQNRIGMMPESGDQSHTTPDAPVSKAPLFPPKSGTTGIKTVSASKPSFFGSKVEKMVGVFKKPALGIGKQKFKLDMPAPDENEVKQIQKAQNALLGPKITVKKFNVDSGAAPNNLQPGGLKSNVNMLSKASLNQMSGTSLNEKRVADSFARPMALKEKT